MSRNEYIDTKLSNVQMAGNMLYRSTFWVQVTTDVHLTSLLLLNHSRSNAWDTNNHDREKDQGKKLHGTPLGRFHVRIILIFLNKAFPVLYVITISSQGLKSNLILSLIINLALSLRVRPLASLCFCYNNAYTFCRALTLTLARALPLLLH
jgi:hypothetical protein